MTGSLVIFTNNNFKSILCGRIVDTRNIFSRKILVTFDHSIRLVKYDTKYIMIECNIFFEPYFHTLKVLQQICKQSLSMNHYLIGTNASVEMPKYLCNIKRTASIKDLNESQSAALNAALSRELVIIQGPPGTGKTFLGLKIVEVLLSSSRNWYNKTSMLILSYTNHALDQFLEGLTRFTDKILRYGGQSKSPKMKNYTLSERRRHYYDSNFEAQKEKLEITSLYKELKIIEDKIKNVGDQLDDISTNKSSCIFDFELLAIDSNRALMKWFLSNKNMAVSWLLEEDESPVGHNLLTDTQDVDKMGNIYELYIQDSQTYSKYHLISRSFIIKAVEKILGKKEEEIKKRKLKNDVGIIRAKVASLTRDCEYLIRKGKYLKMCLSRDFNIKIKRKDINLKEPFKMRSEVRWSLYYYWLENYKKHLKEQMSKLIADYKPVYKDFDKLAQQNTINVMKNQKIIGITTTAAARLHSTIEAVGCPIVIVEEAAEILEAHILPVLTEHCQHLILIGDHKQLKPSTSDYMIENHYQLGVSMFERLVQNNIECNTLNVQHRMRPEISSLITPSIYEKLYDAESVLDFPPIKGVTKSVYFITHSEREEKCGDTSKKNVHEADFLLSLAVYLLQNGYKPEEITILSAYLGQVNCFLEKQKECQHKEVKEIKITSVDNFQGEENRIILLSLVRNNNKSTVGFLSIENRVCVALSRAKEGLYIMGNMEQLTSKSRLWRMIEKSLQKQKALGTELPLKCQQHGNVTKVKTSEDFNVMVPNGGCKFACNEILICGHRCRKICHNEHETYLCEQPCSRSLCQNSSHKCRKQCYQICGKCNYDENIGKIIESVGALQISRKQRSS